MSQSSLRNNPNTYEEQNIISTQKSSSNLNKKETSEEHHIYLSPMNKITKTSL